MASHVVPLNPNANSKVRPVEPPVVSHRPLSLRAACLQFYGTGKGARSVCACASCRALAHAKATRRAEEDARIEGDARVNISRASGLRGHRLRG